MSSVQAPEATDAVATARRRPPQPLWLRVGVIVVLLAVTGVAARSCQQAQIRITKEQAMASAERRVSFEPTNVQVRMLRQGLTSRPFWIVSLSVPREGTTQVFDELAVVRVNANTGKVEDVTEQRARPPREPR